MRAAAGDAATEDAKAGEGGGDVDGGGAAEARNFVFVLSDANFRRYGSTRFAEPSARYHPTHPSPA